MRSRADRIRHALGFEIIGLVLVVAFGDWLFGLEPAHFGVLALVFSVLATVWNYYYNRWFDRILLRYRGTAVKRQRDRVLHALLFEAGLLLMTVPMIAWWLDMSLWQALVADIAMVVFYVVYAYLYNILYDRLFPVGASVTSGAR